MYFWNFDEKLFWGSLVAAVLIAIVGVACLPKCKRQQPEPGKPKCTIADDEWNSFMRECAMQPSAVIDITCEAKAERFFCDEKR